jgi:hypothetical protein
MLISHFRSGDTLRRRSVGHAVLTDTLDVPAPPARLLADWQRETSQNLLLEPGDVEPLPLARAIMRWPDYSRCVQAVSAWTQRLNMPGILDESDIALMACRGARYHHDGAQYGGAAFCNLFMSEDKGLDVHFPALNLRIPLTRGTVMMFDTCQPHAVIRRDSAAFHEAHFAAQDDLVQIFLTWEMPVEAPCVSHALGIQFDVTEPASLPAQPAEEQVTLDGVPAELCPQTGRWLQAR